MQPLESRGGRVRYKAAPVSIIIQRSAAAANKFTSNGHVPAWQSSGLLQLQIHLQKIIILRCVVLPSRKAPNLRENFLCAWFALCTVIHNTPCSVCVLCSTSFIRVCTLLYEAHSCSSTARLARAACCYYSQCMSAVKAQQPEKTVLAQCRASTCNHLASGSSATLHQCKLATVSQLDTLGL